ncbi:restriction endonuclease subunit S [Methylomagnum sp.]
MARRIYEEWFVHFRFPGHENVRMVESELGLIPEGWGVLSFTELFDVRYGKTLPTKNLDPDGQYPVYGGGGVIGRYKDYVVPGPTCLITSRGNGSGTVWRTTEKAFVTNNSFVVTPKGKFQNLSFGFAELFAKNTPIKSVLGGAAQPQLTLDGLTSLRVIAFAANLAKTFDDIIRPLFDLATNLHHKNCNLRTTRDLLLPKLISGELDVSHLPEPLEIAA